MSIDRTLGVFYATPPDPGPQRVPFKIYNGPECHADREETRLLQHVDDLQPGTRFWVRMWGGTPVEFEARRRDDGRMEGQEVGNPSCIAQLDLDRDDRHCWVATEFCMINEYAFAKVKIEE